MATELKDVLHLYFMCDIMVYSNCVPTIKTKLFPPYLGDWSGVKLILRPFSDMTEEEAVESGLGTIARDLEMFNRPWSPKQFLYLLSRGFDLFGLIESKQAIDKTTLSQLGEG